MLLSLFSDEYFCNQKKKRNRLANSGGSVFLFLSMLLLSACVYHRSKSVTTKTLLVAFAVEIIIILGCLTAKDWLL